MFEERFTWQNLLKNPQKHQNIINHSTTKKNCQRLRLQKSAPVSRLVTQFYFRLLERKPSREKIDFININKEEVGNS